MRAFLQLPVLVDSVRDDIHVPDAVQRILCQAVLWEGYGGNPLHIAGNRVAVLALGVLGQPGFARHGAVYGIYGIPAAQNCRVRDGHGFSRRYPVRKICGVGQHIAVC